MSKRKAMTLIEMVVCLSVLAVCFVVTVQGLSHMEALRTQTLDDANLVYEVENLIAELEGQEPKVCSGKLDKRWSYHTERTKEAYVLHVICEERGTSYDFILNEMR